MRIRVRPDALTVGPAMPDEPIHDLELTLEMRQLVLP